MSDHIPLSVLDLASVKQGHTPSDAFTNTLDLARHAEGWGYKRFWLAEHHNMPGIASSATAVLIGHVAGGTKSIRVGSGGVMLPNHAPIVVAEQFGTLAELYPGRIDLGLGRAPGTDPLTVRALRRPINAADDFPNQVQEILHYLGDVKPDQKVQAVPGAGTHVPVWLLGSSDFSAQLAGLLGLPYAFAAHFAPAGLWRAIDLYRNAFTPSEYLQAPYLMVCLPIVAAESDDHARHLATSIQQRILALVRGRPLLQPPPVETMDGLWLPHERQGVENFLGELIVGSAATVGSRLTEFAARSGVNEIMITSDLFDHADRLRSYELIMSVAPKLQSAG